MKNVIVRSESMIKPDFDNSLLNLTASICETYDCKSNYKPLPNLPIEELKKKKNIILMVVDGMGYNLFNELANESLLKSKLLKPLSSVFPSTTAVAITSILTGLSPQEHALTGWFVYLKELGSGAKILPLIPRYSNEEYFKNKDDSNEIYGLSSLIDNFGVDSYFIHLEKYQDDSYQKLLRGESYFYGFQELKEISPIIKNVLNIDNSNNKKFIYTYWNGLDNVSHREGHRSEEALSHFTEIQAELDKIIKSIDFEETALIVTADHGFVDVPDSNKLRVKDIPGLRECLVLPLMGEPRSPYCYLRSRKEKEFKEIWEKYLSSYSSLFQIDEMVEKEIFGRNTINPKFTDRVGDYVIVMNDGFVLLDNVVLEHEMNLKGYHGGMTKDEMLVPLIYIG